MCVVFISKCIKTAHNKIFFNDGTSTACGNTSGMAQLFGTAQKYEHFAWSKVLNYKYIFMRRLANIYFSPVCLSLISTSTFKYKYILQTIIEK